jgi:hypothetical protein
MGSGMLSKAVPGAPVVEGSLLGAYVSLCFAGEEFEQLYRRWPIECGQVLRSMVRAIASGEGVVAPPSRAWPSPHACIAYFLHMSDPRYLGSEAACKADCESRQGEHLRLMPG